MSILDEHRTVRPYARTYTSRAFEGSQFDFGSAIRELRSVECTAIANDESLQLSDDATMASKQSCQVKEMCHTAVSQHSRELTPMRTASDNPCRRNG